MKMLERITEAGNSPDIKIKSFDDAELIAADQAMILNGKDAGKGDIARLPYGNGFIAKTANGIVWVDPAGDYWRIESRQRFRNVKFPIIAQYMD